MATGDYHFNHNHPLYFSGFTMHIVNFKYLVGLFYNLFYNVLIWTEDFIYGFNNWLLLL